MKRFVVTVFRVGITGAVVYLSAAFDDSPHGWEDASKNDAAMMARAGQAEQQICFATAGCAAIEQFIRFAFIRCLLWTVWNWRPDCLDRMLLRYRFH